MLNASKGCLDLDTTHNNTHSYVEISIDGNQQFVDTAIAAELRPGELWNLTARKNRVIIRQNKTKTNIYLSLRKRLMWTIVIKYRRFRGVSNVENQK